ncbi:hypothetical protein FQR65_LT00569 [Abscondita terminalis]|nr:hypothetical protein FQR65_LT00569 [Abscondita terminalis]
MASVVFKFGGAKIDKVAETCQKLRSLHKNIYFASNNNIVGFANLHRRLNTIVPHLPEENLMIPTKAIIDHLKRINFNKKILISGSRQMKEDFIKAGFNITNTENVVPITNIGQFAKEISNDITDVGGVILDYDFNMNILQINQILNCLKLKDTIFITGSYDTKIVMPDNVHILGNYFIRVAAIASMYNNKSTSFGKPGVEFKNYVMKKLNCTDPSRTLFVGDMLDVDIKFGKKCGFKTLLVLTGVSQLKNLKNCPKEYEPDFYLESFGDLFDILEDKLKL